MRLVTKYKEYNTVTHEGFTEAISELRRNNLSTAIIVIELNDGARHMAPLFSIDCAHPDHVCYQEAHDNKRGTLRVSYESIARIGSPPNQDPHVVDRAFLLAQAQQCESALTLRHHRLVESPDLVPETAFLVAHVLDNGEITAHEVLAVDAITMRQDVATVFFRDPHGRYERVSLAKVLIRHYPMDKEDQRSFGTPIFLIEDIV